MMMATIAATLPKMAGVSAPKYLATIYCTPTLMAPTQRESRMFFNNAFLLWSVNIKIMNGRMKNNGESCSTALAAMSQMASCETSLPKASLQSVMTGTPTAPKPVATVLAINDTKALNIGLKPKEIRMAAGIATAVPKPAIPSSRPPKPHTNINTIIPLSSVKVVN